LLEGDASLQLGDIPLTFEGTAAFGILGNPDLLYTPSTGNVQIDADGATILSFVWQSANLFIPPADFSDLNDDVLMGVNGKSDNTSGQIGWVSALSTADPPRGFDGPAIANLGDIFPTGLDDVGLQDLLTRYTWAGPNGSDGLFELVVVPVPEPNAFFFLLVPTTGVIFVWSGRRIWRKLLRS
jgi:hypothetical protein